MTADPAAATRPAAADLTGRVVLITGASRGIGSAAACACAAAGAHVIAVARTQGGLEDLDDAIRAASPEGAGATLVPLDLKAEAGAEASGLYQLAAAIHERWGRLDAMVSNAGVLGSLTPAQQITPREWDEVIAVNLTANHRLIRAMDPLLRASDAGRAVFMTSGAAPRPRAFWGAYAASKAGLEALVRCWADETRQTALRVNIVNPGPTATAMRKKAFPGEDQSTLPTPEAIAAGILPLLTPACARHGDWVDLDHRTER